MPIEILRAYASSIDGCDVTYKECFEVDSAGVDVVEGFLGQLFTGQLHEEFVALPLLFYFWEVWDFNC